MTLRDKAAIVGVGSTPYYKRGRSLPQTPFEMAGKAMLAALDDAGLSVADVDGLALYSFGLGGDTSLFAQVMGVPEVRFTAMLTGGGGGAAGSVGLGAAAIASGMATCVVSLMSLQQAASRFGASYAPKGKPGAQYSAPPSPEGNFIQPAGLMGPGQMFAVLAQRHMHLYGTKREHFAEVAISTRENARRRETSIMRDELTLDDYFDARMIAEPLCLFDFCLECDGAVAVVTTTAERAKDLRHPPAYVRASANGGNGRWGQAITWMGMPDEEFASSGHRPVAKRLWDMAGTGPADVDVALLYDHFSPMVILQLEDYGFCAIGEGGDFVAGGNIRWPSGSLPVNTHGGNLSEAYIIGMTHVREGVEQVRGTAVNQVEGAKVALVTGGPASIPVSSLLLSSEPA
ncbi:MAG: thiolase [Acidimicrobiia bacterium]|jgi:acetyl-CoA acetyltransferase|nr:thiolase [Acidimicrobiia bacterium]